MVAGVRFAVEDTEIEEFSSEDDLLPKNNRTRSDFLIAMRRRAVLAGLGVVALAACGSIVLAGTRLRGTGDGMLSARKLIEETPELHQVAVDNIINTSDRFFGIRTDRDATRDIVATHLGSVTQRLAIVAPEAVHVLESVPVTEEQKAAVVHVLRQLSNHRLQSIGLDVAHAVRDCACDDPDDMKRHIAQKLAPRAEEMRRLYDEVFPQPMRKLLGHGGAFEHLLTPERVRRMRTMNNGWDSYFSENRPTGSRRLGFSEGAWSLGGLGLSGGSQIRVQSQDGADASSPSAEGPILRAEEAVGIIGAVAEEADTLLRIIRPLCKMFDHDLNVPPMVTSGIGAIDFILETVTCELNAYLDRLNPVEVVGCPLQFGSQGFDALREFFALVGILGDNDPTNGKQGNHNGDTTVHWGVLP